jgi:hypothetical protein
MCWYRVEWKVLKEFLKDFKTSASRWTLFTVTKGKLAEIQITVSCMGIDRNVLRTLEVNVNALFLASQGQGGEIT